MKMLFLVTDSEYEPHCMAMMREKGMAGFTVSVDARHGVTGGVSAADRATTILTAVADKPKPRLLIVDDEPDMLDFLERVFRNEYAVTRAASAAEAQHELGQHRYSLIITDQKMPGMTGIEAAETIRRDLDCTIVFMTAYSDSNTLRRARQPAGSPRPGRARAFEAGRAAPTVRARSAA